jgi:hypothetical protein
VSKNEEDSKKVECLQDGCEKILRIRKTIQRPHPWNSKGAAPEDSVGMHIAYMTGKAPVVEPAIHAGILTFSLALRADGGYSRTRLNTPSRSHKIFRHQK